MKVQDVMTSDTKVCGPETDLATAAIMMWNGDCGTLPVIASDGTVVGMITDRDICMATATNDRHASQIAVGEIITGRVFSCAPAVDLRDALSIMQQERVRRLPVIGDDGTLMGILSMNDIVLTAAATGKASDVSYGEVIDTLKSICGQHELACQDSQQVPQQKAAAS